MPRYGSWRPTVITRRPVASRSRSTPGGRKRIKNIRERSQQKLRSTHFHQGIERGHVERALRLANPKFLRLADLAIGFVGPNGHATFNKRDLQEFLAVRDPRTVDDAIAKAVDYGLLSPGSHRRCLRLPTAMWTTFAGAGSADAQGERRSSPCPSCSALGNPASCHPGRTRYSSEANGSLCQQCWRSEKAAREQESQG